MNDRETRIQDLKDIMAKFVKERNWQGFHTPKNLSMALSVEAAELMELFLWTDTDNVKSSQERFAEKSEAVKNEVADVALYVFALCNALSIDLSEAIEAKMKKNEHNYPVAACQDKKAAISLKDSRKKS